MEYSKYKSSRDISWQILINQNISSLPVKVTDICKSMHIRVISYSKGCQYIKNFNSYAHPESNDGFTYQNSIFYNEQRTVQRKRFTVAHELGHILLHNGNGLYNREPSQNDNPIEHEANIFASRLLAPACVLWGLGVTNAHQISEICDISMQSAEFRMKRLNDLYDREKDFMLKYGKSCFLLSPLERAVYEQFRNYINKYKL